LVNQNSTKTTTHSWMEVAVKNSADCSTNGIQETSFSGTSSDTPDASTETEKNVQIPSSDANNAFPHKKNGGLRNYELVHSCPKCFQENAVHRESDRYGTYDSCRLCGWLDNISLEEIGRAPTLAGSRRQVPKG